MIDLTEQSGECFTRLAGPFDLEATLSRLLVQLFNRVLTGGDPAAIPMVTGLASLPPKPRVADFIALPRWLTGLTPLDAVRRAIAKLDEVLYPLIDQRRHESYIGGRDAMWRLANARDQNAAELLPRTEIRDEAASIISAGAHTTVRGLIWLWYLLALNPRVEARLDAELDAVLRAHPPTPDQLTKLVYTRQVIDETMRLYPPVPAMLREAVRDDVVCGHRVPRRSIMAILPWVVHRHRQLWSAPDRFDPERFNPQNREGRPRFAYLPFAVGPRVCVGASLAITQMLIVVAVFARRFRFRLVPDHPIRPVGSVTLRPRGGLRVTVEHRK
jgi:cytochrome P450